MTFLVTAIIKPWRLEEVRDAVQAAGVGGLTASEVQGFGRQGGKTETFRGTEYMVDFVPKVKVEVAVGPAALGPVVEAIAEAGRTGKIGDGKLWVSELEGLMRIRTGELGDDAV